MSEVDPRAAELVAGCRPEKTMRPSRRKNCG